MIVRELFILTVKVNACSTKRGPGVQVQLNSCYLDKANRRLVVCVCGCVCVNEYEYHLNIEKCCFAVKHF